MERVDKMERVVVWDWPVRLMHWLIVLLFTGLIITGKSDGDYLELHFYLGYGLSAVVLARLFYGVLGSHYAKFTQFIYAPKTVIHYALSVIQGRAKHYLGHNPLGGLMVVVLLLALTTQWGTGLFISDETFLFAPFYELISEDLSSELAGLHHQLPNLLLLLVALHLIAVLYHEIRFKERLVVAMLHGKKQLSSDVQQEQSTTEIRTPRVGVLISISVGLAWLAWLWSMPI